MGTYGGGALPCLWLCIHSVPISVEKAKDKPEVEELEPPQSAVSQQHLGKCRDIDTGLHYDRYLREVIEYLEKDPHFREKLKNANMDDIKVHTHLENRTVELSVYLHMLFNLNIAVGTLCLQQGKLSKELDFVQHNFRTKLDELKREEMNRLRLLIKAKHDVQEGNGE
ncbi:hypothetical protein GOODEAATRI_017683 [Goodea atripinnis]|uniref:NUCB1-like N-terminal domain-containing protein n=1 Tax=Goodea atripinnis TaxID=208336 RepID=A0ABV0PEV9_9TELE